MSEFDKDLTPILSTATNEDLDPLVKYILKAATTQTLEINAQYKEHNPNHVKYADVIESEIKEFGGNSFVTLFRGEGPPYYEIVGDVAGKLGANFSKGTSIENIEMAILMKIMSSAWEKMSNEERMEFAKETGIGYGIGSIPSAFPVLALQAAIAASGFLAYRLALIIANNIAVTILGRGLAFATNVAIVRGIAFFTGPIGWAITALWTLKDIAGPAYRVTIPCVIHIAMLRRKFSLSDCPDCSTPYTTGTKFCSNCGKKLSE